MKTKFTSNPNWSNEVLDKTELGLVELIADVDTKSAILAPKKTSALVNSRKITRVNRLKYKVSYGSSRVPYARKRHFENRKNPSTIGYLAKAAESVVRNPGKYFRNKGL